MMSNRCCVAENACSRKPLPFQAEAPDLFLRIQKLSLPFKGRAGMGMGFPGAGKPANEPRVVN